MKTALIFLALGSVAYADEEIDRRVLRSTEICLFKADLEDANKELRIRNRMGHGPQAYYLQKTGEAKASFVRESIVAAKKALHAAPLACSSPQVKAMLECYNGWWPCPGKDVLAAIYEEDEKNP